VLPGWTGTSLRLGGIGLTRRGTKKGGWAKIIRPILEQRPSDRLAVLDQKSGRYLSNRKLQVRIGNVETKSDQAQELSCLSSCSGLGSEVQCVGETSLPFESRANLVLSGSVSLATVTVLHLLSLEAVAAPLIATLTYSRMKPVPSTLPREAAALRLGAASDDRRAPEPTITVTAPLREAALGEAT
jgi:hypothetical protein